MKAYLRFCILFICDLLLGLALLLGGCHAVPQKVTLPTTTAVRAAVVVAQQSNARAVRLAARAQKSGLVAGSADAQALVLATTTTADQLAAALGQIDLLSAQLLRAQARVDQLNRYAADQKARADKAEAALAVADRAKWHARETLAAVLFLGLLAVGLAGAQIETVLRADVRFAWTELKKVPAAVGAGLKLALRLAPLAAL